MVHSLFNYQIPIQPFMNFREQPCDVTQSLRWMVFWNAKQTNKQASKQANMKPQINKHKGKCVSFTDVGVRMYVYIYIYMCINIHTRHVLI